jgi:chromosome segregation ATPase
MVDLNIAHIKGLHVQTYQFQMFQEWITLREENAKLEELIATLQSELADEQEKSTRFRACIAELRARNLILTAELERAARNMGKFRDAFGV